VLFEAPRPLAKLVPDLPPSIVAVVSRMIEKDPDQRYATCAEVAEALEAARAGTELLGTSADLLEFAADASAAADDGSGGEPVTRAARKSRALRQSQALERAQLEQAVALDAAAEGAPDAEDEDADAGETRDQATEAVRAGAREATAPLPPSVVRELEAAKAARAEAQARAEAAAARAVAPAAVAPAVKAPPAAPGLPLPLIIGAAVLVLGLLAYFLF